MKTGSSRSQRALRVFVIDRADLARDMQLMSQDAIRFGQMLTQELKSAQVQLTQASTRVKMAEESLKITKEFEAIEDFRDWEW